MNKTSTRHKRKDAHVVENTVWPKNRRVMKTAQKGKREGFKWENVITGRVR